jgi:hypothetical protein
MNSFNGKSNEKTNPFDSESDRIIKVGALSVNEAKMYIYPDKDMNFQLHIPVSLEADSANINPTVSVNVTDLSGENVDGFSKEQKVSITSATTELILDLGKNYIGDPAEVTSYLFKYSFSWSDYNLSGKMSLFRIIPRIKTQILGTDRVIAGETSNFRVLVSNVLSGDPIMS